MLITEVWINSVGFLQSRCQSVSLTVRAVLGIGVLGPQIGVQKKISDTTAQFFGKTPIDFGFTYASTQGEPPRYPPPPSTKHAHALGEGACKMHLLSACYFVSLGGPRGLLGFVRYVLNHNFVLTYRISRMENKDFGPPTLVQLK